MDGLHFSLFWGTILLSAWFTFQLKDPLFRACLGYPLFRAMVSGFFFPQGGVDIKIMGSMLGAADFAFVLVMTVLFVKLGSAKAHRNLLRAFVVLELINGAFIISRGSIGGMWGGSVYGGVTHDTFIMVLAMPVAAWLGRKWWYTALGLGAMALFIGGVTAKLGIGIYLAMYLIRRFRYGWLLAVPLFVGAAGLIYSHGVGERGTLWADYVGFWRQRNLLFGLGPGSFKFLSSFGAFQDIPRLWAHSDWIQLAFEFGLVGFILGLMLYASTLWKLRNEAIRMSFFLALGIGMCSYSPMQYILVFVVTFIMGIK